jgi:beta-lactamase regulating signal transducer with metallopeptidase domain
MRSLGALYLTGLAYLLFARIKKHVHVRWILRFTYKAPDEIEDIFRPIAESQHASNVQLLMLSGIYSPATFGWIRPIILLPAQCLEEADHGLEDVFRHELQHVQRRDFVFQAIASCCRALLFFHPAAWYAMRRLELESELACDLAVIGDSPDRRATYAECLVRFARLRVTQEPTPWNLDFAGSSVQLQVRIRSILAGARKIPGWMLGLRTAVGVLLLIGFLAAAPSLFVVLSYERQEIEQPVAHASTPSSHDVYASKNGTPKVGLREQSLRTSRAFAAPASDTLAIGSSEAASEAPLKRVVSSEPGPSLKRRGDPAGSPKSAAATTILLSDSPASQSADSAERRASVASAISAGVSEAAHIASRGHDKDVH